MQRRPKMNSSRAVSATFGLALAGTIAAVSLANPAVAAGVAHSLKCALSTTCYAVTNTGSGAAIAGTAVGGSALIGTNKGSAATGSFIQSGSGDAVAATATSGIAVNALGSAGYALQAISNGATALNALSKSGNGINVSDGGNSAASAIAAVGTTVGGFGIISQATNNYGVAGYFVNDAPGGVNTSPALQVQGDLTNSGNPVADFYNSKGSVVQEFLDTGDVVISGRIFTAGNCSGGCAKQKLGEYASTAALPTIEDDGEARLVRGMATVALDGTFASALDAKRPYIVTITPEGETHGLYVAQRGAGGFVVRENSNGAANVAFAYHIVARPYGQTAPRLPYLSAGRSIAPVSDMRKRYANK